MEQDPTNGFRRSLSHQGMHSRPVERRPSKKSSSQDRHGRVYPDTFRDTTIRTVTPDSLTDPGNQSPLSESEYTSPAAGFSPRSTTRSHPAERDRRGDFHPYPATAEEDEGPADWKTRRTRARTTTLEEQRSEPPAGSVFFRNRNRLGSLTVTKSAEDSVSSIGFPSIIQTAAAASQGSLRQRLTKSPPGGPSNNTTMARNPPSFLGPPLSSADSTKILSLMKTTCGRMHGVLSYRTPNATSWTSGYCAINVVTGSLICQATGQATGETALAKTLIPDLRGCRVRTLFDPDAQTTYLSVSTFSAALGIQLRPEVPETFDSWLAALLCWQPIRPKGAQNKRTKPQSVAITDRRLVERRKDADSSNQKEAAIIKFGNMLLWEKPSASGVRPSSSRRTSTYRQQRAFSTSWQKVSCTLQENGHFKLFTDSESAVVATVHLSQLSRCAVQQLESSVLDDEYCIAIYPQYTAVPTAEVRTRPIFLSLDSRVLFEVWFVLLRAFTIPELYGPETGSRDGSGSPSAPPTADMFRIERLLSLRIIEAKFNSKKDDDVNKKKSSGKSQSIKSSQNDYYSEVLLDGEIRAKTAVKQRTATPFWREDFTFPDLPPVLSNASILVKTMNPAQKDWTLIAHGPYTLDADTNPMNILNDLEVSTQDATCGSVDLDLTEIQPGADVEKWWPILDERDEQVGEMLMKVRLEETVVLMSYEYEPMSELLHSFNNNLTVNMVQFVPAELLNHLSEILLNIFQVSGQSTEWISALIEDEIDGIHRDSSVNRLRYTSRIHSNESKESVSDREVFVRDMGRSATIEANLLFRGNSLLTKALDMHMRRLGKEYLEETIGERLRDIDESDPDCEVDPMKVHRPEDLERNWRNLIALTSLFWKSIHTSAARCPTELRRIFRRIRACAEDRYGEFLRSISYSSVSGFLFLRFFCPAILNPKLFGLLKDHPRPRAQRTLTLIAKALQGLANMTTFGNKEPWMEPMNKFLLSSRGAFKEFVDAICSISAERPVQTVSPSYATPIQILGRLPPTSREGFPSLPYLVDHARSFSALTNLWLDVAPDRLGELSELEPAVARFHNLALALQRRTEECMSRAEQAERPTENLNDKWEELIESMDRSITFYDDDSTSKPSTPATEGPLTAPPIVSNRNSFGYFPRPPMARRSTENGGENNEDEGPSQYSAVTWDSSRLPLSSANRSESRERASSSRNSSTYSLDYSDTPKARQSREVSGKHRLFKRKNKESST